MAPPNSSAHQPLAEDFLHIKGHSLPRTTTRAVELTASHPNALEECPLPPDSQARLGVVDDDEDTATQCLPSHLCGRRAIVIDAAASILSDHWSYPDSFIQLPRIDPTDVFKAAGDSQPEDAGGQISGSSGGAAFPQNRAGGGNANSLRRNGKKAVRDGKADVSQGSKRKVVHYNDALNTAVEMRTPLPAMAIGATELLTFFPNHTQWHAVSLRLYWNGWSAKDIAKAQLHPRQQSLDEAEFVRRRNALKHQLRTVVRSRYGEDATPAALSNLPHPHFRPFTPHASGNSIDLYNVTLPLQQSGLLFQPPRNLPLVLQPATLQQVVNGVVNWPTGQDAGWMTRVLEWAVANNQLHRTTNDLPNIAATLRAQGQMIPLPEMTTITWDQNGVARLRANVADP